MPLDAFLELNGITGSARQKGREGHITVRGYRHTVGAVTDAKGVPTKEARPGYLVVQKDLDIASPKLFAALHENTKISTATLRFWRMPPGGGNEENYYSISLTGVRIVSISGSMPYNREQDNSLLPEVEEIAFSFDTVGYAFASGGQEGSSVKQTTSSSGPFSFDEFDAANETLGDLIKSSVSDGVESAAGAWLEALKQKAAEPEKENP